MTLKTNAGRKKPASFVSLLFLSAVAVFIFFSGSPEQQSLEQRVARQFRESFLAPAMAPTAIAASAYYVSPAGADTNPGTAQAPFRTLERARDAVRLVSGTMSSNITIYLRGGTYELQDTFTLTHADSGKNGFSIIYRAYPGERVVLSGGQRLSGWVSAGNGLYKTNVGGLLFRQLYVDGRRAVRAREPDTGFYRAQSWDLPNKLLFVDPNQVGAWSRLQEVELSWIGHWVQGYYRISNVTMYPNAAMLSFAEPDKSGLFVFPSGMYYDNPLFFTNAYEFLDTPGEWYLNPGTSELFYLPRSGENMASVEAVVPNIQTLVRLEGTLDAPVHHLQFRDIAFQYSNWNGPSTHGFLGRFSDVFLSSRLWAEMRVPAAVHIQNANNTVFERNIFQGLGGGGLALYSGTTDNVIQGNVFQDVAASGLSVDLAMIANPPDQRSISRRNVVKNNYVTRIGLDYYGSVGILSLFTDASIIEHNEVEGVPYSGIVAGLDWGSPSPVTQLKNNSIRYNLIHRAMQLLDDGGGIYLKSIQPGTVVAENYVHSLIPSAWQGGWGLNALYLDNNSNSIRVANNVVENVPMGLFLQTHAGTEAKNNTIVNFLGTISGNIAGNTFLTDSTFNPTAVKANAGLESAYRDIKSLAAAVASAKLPTTSSSAIPLTTDTNPLSVSLPAPKSGR